MKKTAIVLLSFFLILGLTPSLDAIQKAEHPELRKEVVKVNYIDARSAVSILNPYTSGYGKIQLVRESNMLIIEDIPEMVEKILSILKEIDIKPLDLQFTVDLIIGSMKGERSENRPRPKPAEKLKSDPLMKELTRVLAFEFFEKLDSTLIKVQDNSRSTQRMGGEGLTFRLDLQPRYIKEEGSESMRVELRLTKDSYKNDGSLISLTLIDTTISLKSGERSVVGVSKLDGGDEALILILSGKVLK
jgi:hypothetical protein